MDPCALLAGAKGELRCRRVKGCVVLHSSVLVNKTWLSKKKVISFEALSAESISIYRNNLASEKAAGVGQYSSDLHSCCCSSQFFLVSCKPSLLIMCPVGRTCWPCMSGLEESRLVSHENKPQLLQQYANKLIIGVV